MRCISRSLILLAGLAIPLWAQPSGPGRVDADFQRRLKQEENCTWQDLGKRFGAPNYLEKLPFDPTSARYWKELNQAPPPKPKKGQKQTSGPRVLSEQAEKMGVEPNGTTAKGSFGRQDLRLDASEINLFKKNGFVVSERLGQSTMTAILYKIYAADLPIYVSAECVLHAWHQAHDKNLMIDELRGLAPQLTKLLQATHQALAKLEGADQQSLADVDLYLTIALSLNSGNAVQPINSSNEVATIVSYCKAETLTRCKLFGAAREIDFSKLRPNGHYRERPELSRYYRTLVWMSLAGWYVDGDSNWAREAEAMLTLARAIKASGTQPQWLKWQQAIERRVGLIDGLSLTQVFEFLDKHPELTAQQLQQLLRKSDVGREYICARPVLGGGGFYRRFFLAGAAYSADSYALSQCVYPNVRNKKDVVVRRIPSCLDVCFAVLGSNRSTAYLLERNLPQKSQSPKVASQQDPLDPRPESDQPALRQFRDGLNYQSNLIALRQTFDAARDSAPGYPNGSRTSSRPAGKPRSASDPLGSSYTSKATPAKAEQVLDTGPAISGTYPAVSGRAFDVPSLWIRALQQLSAPPDARCPSAMKTAAWADRLLNTQCASWAQLRRDFQLYLKEPESGGTICEYPFGYVEPRPEFWKRMEELAESQNQGVSSEFNDSRGYYANFAQTMRTLREISEAELAGRPLSKAQHQFLRQMLEVKNSRGCGGPFYNGWYFKLYGPLRDGSPEEWEPTVTSAHRDAPSPAHGDPGGYVLEGTGCADLMVVAVDSGPDKMVYLGPVLSHYEWFASQRMDEGDWKGQVESGLLPERPEWTRTFLAPLKW